MADSEAYTGWAIVELMGHRRLAGEVREVAQYGAAMLAIDVPTEPPITQFYGGSAVYCVTPCTEATAREIVGRAKPAAVCELLHYAPRYDEPELGTDPDDEP